MIAFENGNKCSYKCHRKCWSIKLYDHDQGGDGDINKKGHYGSVHCHISKNAIWSDGIKPMAFRK